MQPGLTLKKSKSVLTKASRVADSSDVNFNKKDPDEGQGNLAIYIERSSTIVEYEYIVHWLDR